jgi:hypothetical protein
MVAHRVCCALPTSVESASNAAGHELVTPGCWVAQEFLGFRGRGVQSGRLVGPTARGAVARCPSWLALSASCQALRRRAPAQVGHPSQPRAGSGFS